MPWRDGLDIESAAYSFITSDSKVIRSVAGPGTGKSFAMRRKIAKLISEGTDPAKILAITFTRTAAADLKKEIHSLRVNNPDKVTATTIHSLCLQILYKREILITTGRFPRIILNHELTPLLRDMTNTAYGNLLEKKKRVIAFTSGWARLQVDEPGYAPTAIDDQFGRELIDLLKKHKAMLIGEVVPLTLNYLRNNPVCDEINRFEHVLVDEYQDLNKAEQELIKTLRGEKNIIIVGDDDQSIYAFKHAHPEGIRQVPSIYNDCVTIPFDVCRRCPKKVVRLASKLISENSNRTLGALLPFDENDEGDVNILQWEYFSDEIEGLATIVHRELSVVAPQDILILSPRRLIGYKLRDRLEQLGVNVKSYFREESLRDALVKEAFEILYYIAYPDDTVSLRYLLGGNSSDFKAKQYDIISQYAASEELSISETLDKLVIKDIVLKSVTHIVRRYVEVKNKAEEFKNFINNSPENLFSAQLQSTAGKLIFDEINQIYIEAIETIEKKDDEEAAVWFRRVFVAVLNKITMPEIPKDVDHVRIMSLHASKGLSAKFVIIVSANEALLPFISQTEESEAKRIEEEQRRLFYVAMTRCENEKNEYVGKLVVSSFIKIDGHEALRMNIPAKPGRLRTMRASRFITELGQECPRPIAGKQYIDNNA